jgi:tRNA wybutosine-synthesizing protein 1
MDQKYKALLEKQGYRFTGKHSAIKICDWTKQSIKNNGVCYKEKFYGITSHQCCQISLAVNFCDKDCIYCWRERKNFPFSSIDEPKEIIPKADFFQNKLLDGFKGLAGIDMKKFLESKEIKSYAISLTGENLYYPKINEFIKLAKKNKKKVFLVTHGGFPEALKKLEMPTQLYISMDAPNEKLFNSMQRSMHKNAWNRYLECLKILAKLKKKTRTVIRLTLVRNINFDKKYIDEYAKLIELAKPDFIEVKSYMWMGASKQRLTPQHSPFHEDIVDFCNGLVKKIPYRIVDEQEVSKVVLLQRKDSSKKRIISR